MGNTEAIPEQKMTTSIKTKDKVFSTDESKVPCDRDMTENSSCSGADNGIETIGDLDETASTDKSTLTNGGSLNRSPQSSLTVEKR